MAALRYQTRRGVGADDFGKSILLKLIPFLKYTSCGNNFVVVDETRGPVLSETEKAYCATQAANPFFGVGADGMVVVQPCDPRTLLGINDTFRYWRSPPDPDGADLVFRLFERNGTESFSCGNGLLCVAHHLGRRYDVGSARILTGIPTPRPRAVDVGCMPEAGGGPGRGKTSWVNMGVPGRVPSGVVEPAPTDIPVDGMDRVDLTVRFRRRSGLRFFDDNADVRIRGYLVFTGEPHLVIFTEEDISERAPAETLFVPMGKGSGGRSIGRANTGAWFVQYVGSYLTREYARRFPMGINVDFVRVVGREGILEYRCFERGIERETLACGTGAVAAAYAARRLDKIEGDRVTIRPHRCRWYDPEATLRVEGRGADWFLFGEPLLLCRGEFFFNKSYMVPSAMETCSMTEMG